MEINLFTFAFLVHFLFQVTFVTSSDLYTNSCACVSEIIRRTRIRRMSLIKQGAEGKLYVGEYKGAPCLVKERFVKHYRHPDLDQQLTKERIRAEVKSIGRCRSIGVDAPEIYHSDLEERKIYMEYYPEAITAKEYLFKSADAENRTELLDELASRLGAVIGKLHANNIIHGDLTTSNVLLRAKDKAQDVFQGDYQLIMIDFGLSQYQSSAEAKAVDLYVLERALLSTHSTIPELFEKILESYSKANVGGRDSVIAKFEEVRARGRKRTMIG